MSEAISSSKVVKKPDTVIDPRLFTPPGIIDVTPGTRDDFDGYAYVQDKDYEDDGSSVTILPDTHTGVRLVPPASMVIVSKTLRHDATGRQVVDVVIEVEDIATATGYDVQVTKADAPVAVA